MEEALTIFYNNGYVIKSKNRRIAVFMEEDSYVLYFKRYRDDLLTAEQKEYFDETVDRFNRTLTIKSTQITDEAFRLMTFASMRFLDKQLTK